MQTLFRVAYRNGITTVGRHSAWSRRNFPPCTRKFSRFWHADAKLAIQPAALRFVASVKPGSQLLLDRCFAALTTDSADFQRGPFAAAEILAENFGGDRDVYSRLLRELPIARNGTLLSVRPQLAVALCVGWPASEIIDELYRHEVERRGATGDHQAFFEVRLSRYPIGDFPNLLRKHLAASGVQANRHIARSLAKAAIRRITTDEESADALLGTLAEKLESTDKASVPRILAAASVTSLK